MKIAILIFIISLLFPPIAFVHAAGIGVKPARFEIQGTVDEMIVKELTVTNNGREAALYRVSADSLVDWFTIIPSEFQLLPNESQTIEIRVIPQGAGAQAVFISAVARSLDRQSFNAALGLKIPIQMIISDISGANYNLLIITLLVILVLTFIFILYKINHRHKSLWYKTKHNIDLLWAYRKPWYSRYIEKLLRKL